MAALLGVSLHKVPHSTPQQSLLAEIKVSQIAGLQVPVARPLGRLPAVVTVVVGALELLEQTSFAALALAVLVATLGTAVRARHTHRTDKVGLVAAAAAVRLHTQAGLLAVHPPEDMEVASAYTGKEATVLGPHGQPGVRAKGQTVETGLAVFTAAGEEAQAGHLSAQVTPGQFGLFGVLEAPVEPHLSLQQTSDLNF